MASSRYDDVLQRACPQAVAARRPWLSYTAVLKHCFRRIFLEWIAAMYAGCSTLFCSPFLSGQRKRLISFSSDLCAHATAWFWFRLLRIYPTLLSWKLLLRQASLLSNSSCKLFCVLSEHLPRTETQHRYYFFCGSPFCFLLEYGACYWQKCQSQLKYKLIEDEHRLSRRKTENVVMT